MALQLQVSELVLPRRDGKNCFWLRPRKDNHPDGGGRGRGGGGGGRFGGRRGWRGMCVWEDGGSGRGYWMLQGRRREPIRGAIDQFPPLSHSWRARCRTESVRLTADWTHSQKHLDPPTSPPTPILQSSPTPDGRDRKSFAVAVYMNTGFTELKAHRPKPSFFENAPQGVFF